MMKVKSKKIIAIIAVVLVAILAIVLAMLFTRCGNHSSATPDQAQATTATIAKSDTTSTQLSTDASGKVIDPTTAKADGDTSVKATEAKASDTSSKSDSTSSKSDSSSASSKSGDSSGGSSGNASTSGGSTSGGGSGSDKTYHEAVYKTVHHDAEYEDVYVVDQEAYSYEEPVYQERQITVCHVCGAEFDTSYSTSEFYAHDDQHLLAGEGSGWHSDVRKVQVGTNTVNVPEEGHYEKKVVKAAWDEKVLVKEAGWY